MHITVSGNCLCRNGTEGGGGFYRQHEECGSGARGKGHQTRCEGNQNQVDAIFREFRVTRNPETHRSRFSTNGLDIENDHEALGQRGAQMMRTGDLDTALGLINKAVEVFTRLQAELG